MDAEMHAVSNCNSRVWCCLSCRYNQYAGIDMEPNEVHNVLAPSTALSCWKSVISSKERRREECLLQPL
jgi:hypothetical protein